MSDSIIRSTLYQIENYFLKNDVPTLFLFANSLALKVILKIFMAKADLYIFFQCAYGEARRYSNEIYVRWYE